MTELSINNINQLQEISEGVFSPIVDADSTISKIHFGYDLYRKFDGKAIDLSRLELVSIFCVTELTSKSVELHVNQSLKSLTSLAQKFKLVSPNSSQINIISLDEGGDLSNLYLPNLKKLGGRVDKIKNIDYESLNSLEKLHTKGSTKTLNSFFEFANSIDHLYMINSNIVDFNELQGLVNFRYLSLNLCKKLESLSGLGKVASKLEHIQAEDCRQLSINLQDFALNPSVEVSGTTPHYTP